MNGAAVFFIVLIVLLIAAAVGWITFTQLRARRLGLPPPSLSSYIPFRGSNASAYGAPTPAPGGIRGWFNDKLRGLRGRQDRSAAGAYESTTYPGGSGGSYRRGGGGGFGPLDPDEAWDTRVGTEADAYGPGGYYEEQELGMHSHARDRGGDADPYAGSGYNMNLATTPGATSAGYGDHHEARGRSRDRDADDGHLGVGARGGARAQNPFDDDAAEPSNMSLRGVSPRPIVDTHAARAAGKGQGPGSASPTGSRKSVFRENV